MSNLSTIYTALEAVSVTVSSITPAVDKPDELKPTYESADLPRRLFLPLGNNAQGIEGRALTLGASPIHTNLWELTELLLWAPAGAGLDGEHLPFLRDYCTAYGNALAAAVRLIVSPSSAQQATIEKWRFLPGMVNYPRTERQDVQGASVRIGKWYYGVETTLYIRELG